MAGCSRTPKSELIDKGIIRKAETESKEAISSFDAVSKYSRPGSAYVRVAHDPLRPPTAMLDPKGRSRGGYTVSRGLTSSKGARVPTASKSSAGPIDPLANVDVSQGMERKPSLRTLGL